MRKAPEELRTIVRLPVEAMGYELVGVELFRKGASGLVLRVYIDREDGITLDDCSAVSHQISGVLDVEDPISGAYTLEVSSPGLDRPLVRPNDFERFAGLEAKIELRESLNGRRRYRGVLAGCADAVVTIVTEDGTAALPFDEIDNAKLVITDELLAAGSADALKQGRA